MYRRDDHTKRSDRRWQGTIPSASRFRSTAALKMRSAVSSTVTFENCSGLPSAMDVSPSTTCRRSANFRRKVLTGGNYFVDGNRFCSAPAIMLCLPRSASSARIRTSIDAHRPNRAGIRAKPLPNLRRLGLLAPGSFAALN